MTWSQIPALCAVLGVVGLVLMCWPTAATRLAARWEARQAARWQRRAEETRQRAEVALLSAGTISVNQLRELRARPADAPVVRQAIAAIEQEVLTKARGRHRPELAGPDAVSATGIMRALNADADQLPAISRRAVKR